MKKIILCLTICFVIFMVVPVTAEDMEQGIIGTEWGECIGFERDTESQRSSVYELEGTVPFSITFDGVIIANVSPYMAFEVSDGVSARVLRYDVSPSYTDISGDAFNVMFDHSNYYYDGSGAYVQYYFLITAGSLSWTYRQTTHCSIYGELSLSGGAI